MSQLHTLILAGGSGTRLWPLSRKQYPKQFIQLALFDGKSLFQKTLERALLGSDITQIRIVTNESYKFHCRSQAEEIGVNLTDANLILEPLARNTLAAILLGLENIPSEADVLVLSSDHAIGDELLFAETVKNNLEATKDSIVLFGVQPASAHTGYGYIRPEQAAVRSKVLEFKEKPDFETAQRYVASGYLWNSGIFLFKKSVFVDQLRAINPAYLNLFESSDDLVERFTKLPDVSVDVGLLEKSSSVAVLPFPSYWSDLGSFDALEEYAKLTNKRESVIEIAGANNFRISDDISKPIVLIGMDNTIVVDTTDAILITRKGASQWVKEAVKLLEHSHKEITEFHRTVYRPWGSYTIIDEGTGFKTKRLTVLPGKKLSLQLHHQRSEHWVVVSGIADVTIGEKDMLLKRGESVFIPIETKHRLGNSSDEVLHLIESQIGDYLEEDDIVRFDDVFGRK